MKVRLCVAAIFAVSALSATTITGLFNTGASTTGSADNVWTIVSPPGAGQVVGPVFVPVLWLPNTAASSWEWRTNTGQPVGTPTTPLVYTFRHLFILDPSYDASTVQITGRWSTDNFGTDILVNGQSTAQTSPNFLAWSSFTLSSGFVSGLNVVDFVVSDVGFEGGFRVEWLTADAASSIPEPSSWTMLVAGVAAIGFARIRRSR